MPDIDSGLHQDRVVIPFPRDDAASPASSAATTTTMAALLAVTVVHDPSISAEERLIQIIEKSGEVEILDTEDALADMGFEPGEIDSALTKDAPPANDNTPVKVV